MSCKDLTPEKKEEIENEIRHFCQEHDITREEFEGWMIGNIMIGWMRQEKKKMKEGGRWIPGWSKRMKLPFITLEKVKQRRGKKKLILPNIFKLCDEIREHEKFQREFIDYICPNCKATIWRHKDSRSPCSLCGAPYNFNIQNIKELL